MISPHPRVWLVLFMIYGIAAGAAPPEPPGITLDEARTRALASNPAGASALQAVEAADGALRQAKAWPNPELEIEAEEFGLDRPGWDEAEISWLLAQRLELFGSRRARVQVARFERDAAARAAETVRRELSAEVERRFASALTARDRLVVLALDDSLAGEAARGVRALVEAGEVSPIELDRAEAERARTRVQQTAAGVEYARARRALAELWGAGTPDFAGVEGSLESVLDAVPPSTLEPGPSPELLRAEAQVRGAQAALNEAARSRWPEPTIRGGVRRARGPNEQAYLGGAGLEVPLWDRRGGARQEARARLEMARSEQNAVRAQVEIAVGDARDALGSALASAQSLGETELPRARAIHEAIEEGYRRGKFGLLELIDARRHLLQTRLDHLEALRSVWIARADLARWAATESTTGSPEDEGGSR